MICKKCNEEFDGTYCPMCGANCTQEEAIPAKKKRKRLWWIIAASAVLVVALVLGLLFGFNILPNPFSASSPEVDGIMRVSDTLEQVITEEMSADDKYTAVYSTLEELQTEGLVTNVAYNAENEAFSFEYPDGGKGIYLLKEAYSEEEWGLPAATVEQTALANVANDATATQSDNQRWLFLFYANEASDKTNYDWLASMQTVYQQCGIEVDLVTNYTVDDFANWQGYDLIYVVGHGCRYADSEVPYILTDEIVTEESLKKAFYKEHFDKRDIVQIFINGRAPRYMIAASFFENCYPQNELDGAIVLNTCCELLGTDTFEYTGFADAYLRGGADAAIGFRNSVSQSYSMLFYERMILHLLEGRTVTDAFENTLMHYGEEEDFFETYVVPSFEKDVYAQPMLFKDSEVRLFTPEENKTAYWGEYAVTLVDPVTKMPVEGAVAVVYDQDEDPIREFRAFTTNTSGTVTVKLPKGDYTMLVSHDYYEDFKTNFSVTENVLTVLSDEMCLVRKSGQTHLTVVDETTGEPVAGVQVDVVSNEGDGRAVASTVSGADGQVAVDLTYGSYTFTFRHEDYQTAGCSMTVDSDSTVLLESFGLKKAKKVLTPEQAVDIYMANKNLWMNTPTYNPMQGYAYCLLDLDFDGVLELIFSANDGSGRFSYNHFYQINQETKTVEEFHSQRDAKESGLDYYYCASKSQLLKSTATGQLFYVFGDHTRVSYMEYGTSYYKVYKEGDVLAEESIFFEYTGPDYENNDMSTQIQKFRFEGESVSQAVFEQKKSAFYADNPDQHLTRKYVKGDEFAKASASAQKQLLLEAYRAFSYDGFSFE